MYSEHQLLTLGAPRSGCGNRPENRAGASLNSGAAKAFVGRLQSPTVRVASCRRFKPPYQVRYMEKSCSRRTQSTDQGCPNAFLFRAKSQSLFGLGMEQKGSSLLHPCWPSAAATRPVSAKFGPAKTSYGNGFEGLGSLPWLRAWDGGLKCFDQGHGHGMLCRGAVRAPPNNQDRLAKIEATQKRLSVSLGLAKLWAQFSRPLRLEDVASIDRTKVLIHWGCASDWGYITVSRPLWQLKVMSDRSHF